MRFTRVPAAAIARALAIPFPVSMIGMMSITARRQAALALERADQPVEGDDLLAALDHRQDDAVEPGTDHRHRVAITELGS